MAEPRGDQPRADLDVLLDTVDLGIFIFDAAGNVVSMSRWARERLLDHLGRVPETLATMVGAAERIAELVRRLQGIVRFEERDVGGGPMLDLEAATTERRRRPRI